MTTRRAFLLGTSAAVVAMAVAPSASTAKDVTRVVDHRWWGISYDGEIYNTMTATSKEAAIAEALEECPEGGVEVALCEEIPLCVPDFREQVVEHMFGECTLDVALVNAATGACEDADFEGEICAAIADSDTSELVREVRVALDASLARHGRPDLIGRNFYDEPLDPEDALLDKIEADEVLRLALKEAGQRWFDREGFENTGSRTLTLYDEHKIPRTETVATAAAQLGMD